jgi:hypothetical protein
MGVGTIASLVYIELIIVSLKFQSFLHLPTRLLALAIFKPTEISDGRFLSIKLL